MARRRFLALASGAGASALLGACGGASLGGGDEQGSGAVKIGLLLPQSGAFTAIGEDLRRGFDLYLEGTGGKLGGRPATIVTADEGENADTGKAAAERLLKQERVLALTGVVNSVVLGAIKDLVQSARVPLVGSNASPTGLADADFIWRTSFRNDQPGRALGAYVAAQPDGRRVAVIAADYQAGRDEVTGFREAYEAAGGTIADVTWTPFPATRNFLPYLQRVGASKATAVFCFYAGTAAVDFVKQYHEAGLTQPLYAPGFLTEGGVLQAQADRALGIRTALNYAADLPGEDNRRFVEAYQARNGKRPTTYAVASYDAAAVLDRAVAAAGAQPTSQSVNTAIGTLGDIASPRGTWRFTPERVPAQAWYLREVRQSPQGPVNALVRELLRLS
ncbi:ABC transporter substrate-binding protein [Catellatospora citrea]|uniref:ABC transporter substrate-binding protein n=1 Tax=Catellatospora citrea TaxID=53366 RepID=UPI0033C2438D